MAESSLEDGRRDIASARKDLENLDFDTKHKALTVEQRSLEQQREDLLSAMSENNTQSSYRAILSVKQDELRKRESAIFQL